MQYALADTGVWYAMFDPRDPYWGQTDEKEDILALFNVVVPWPTMYETLRTRMVRNKKAMQLFEVYLKHPRLIYLDDTPYRADAFDMAMSSSLRRARPLSMIDCLLRLILDDANIAVNYFATFNDRDFGDVCCRRRIEIF